MKLKYEFKTVSCLSGFGSCLIFCLQFFGTGPGLMAQTVKRLYTMWETQV